jgi:hypothetical protein
MKTFRHQFVVPSALSLLLIIIALSFCISNTIQIDQDELGALLNVFVPVIVGALSLIIMAIVLIFSKKERMIFYALTFLSIINIATGIFLKLSFKGFSPLSAINYNEGFTTSTVQISSLVTPLEEPNDIDIKNLDGLPNNGALAFSFVHKSGKISSDISKNTFDHQEATFRLTNNTPSGLNIIGTSFSDKEFWSIKSIKKDNKVQGNFPVVIVPGGQLDITVAFNTTKIEQRIKAPWWKYLFKTQNFLLTQARNFNYQGLSGTTCANIKGILVLKTDSKTKPYRNIYLNGLWQYRVEGDWEPDLQRVVNTLGFTTLIGFKNFDNGLKGDKLVPFSDEVVGNYFSAAQHDKLVRITKIAAYHGCCSIEAADSTSYYYSGKNKIFPLFFAIPRTGQMLFPNDNTCVNSVCFKPDSQFALKIGKSATERKMNFQHKIGVRIWKARDTNGTVISNAFILGADHLGAKGTNYDYQDEVFYIENVKVE